MTLLKSINIITDFFRPERAAHYRPTRKSVDIIRAVVGTDTSRATAIIASYGTGKSIAALVGSLIVEADPKKMKVIPKVIERLTALDPALASEIEMRRKGRKKGLVITLSGYVNDLPGTLSHAVNGPGAETLQNALEHLGAALQKPRIDRIAIIWDEFGRHLEHLVSIGAAEELAVVQDLAEWAPRRRRSRATLTLLLHQEFQRYAGRLGQIDQGAWRKIEGRFDALRVLDDSDEILSFVAEVVEELRPASSQKQVPASTLKAVKDLGLFPFLPRGAPLRDFLTSALPIMPAVLHLLPRIAGRIGQSERTILDFINDTVFDTGLDDAITIENLYVYFSVAMRADTAPGGTYRRHVEIESARSRCRDALEREIIAAAALAQLGGTDNRTRVGKDDLASFMRAGSIHSPQRIVDGINALLERKLLLHRHLTDDISVWHGADIDIRSLAAEAAESLRATTRISGGGGEILLV